MFNPFKLFSGKMREQSSSFFGFGPAQWDTNKGLDFANEGYCKNVIAYRCVSIIAKSLASVPMLAKQNGKELPSDHPLLMLLKKPNPLDAGSEFFQAYTSYKLIDGNSYMEKIRPTDSAPPKELWVWDPFLMKVVTNKKSRIPVAYKYGQGQNEMLWTTDRMTGMSDILQWKNFNPLNQFLGMSPMKPGGMSIDQHNASSLWNFSLLKNNALPSGLLFNEKEGISSTQAKNIRKELDNHQVGPINARKTMVLEGHLKFQQMSTSPVDMDFLNGHKSSAAEIAAAFGVPLQVIPIDGSQTFANYEQARLALWEDTVLPLLDSLLDELNMWLAPDFGEKIELYYDENQISALEIKRANRMEKFNSVKFLTINEKREANGYERIEVETADQLFQSSSEFPIGFDFSESSDEEVKAILQDYGMESKKIDAFIRSTK